MDTQLVMAVVMEALDGCVLDRAVHALDLPVGPGMVGLCQPMLDLVGLTDHVEVHRPGIDGVPVAGLLGELDSIIGENGVDLIGHGFQHMLQELLGRASVSLFNELGHGELTSSVYAHEEIELSFDSLHLCNIDVEEPNRVALELLATRFVPLDIGQAGDAMPLQAQVQR